MNTRYAIIGGVALLVLAATGTAWYATRPVAPAAIEPIEANEPMEDDGPLPIPPVPPRIAEGGDYEKCLGMLTNDPAGASTFAEAWEATGGGDGATHCLGLATVALGEPEKGAQMLEQLASTSKGTDVSRATVYGQADQAWLIAGDAAHAFGAATLALSLSPDDPDLLVDRAVAAGILERYQDSIDDLTRALDLDPKRPDAYTYRGSAWRHLGALDLAQDDIDRALILDPDQPDALLERGILRQRKDNPDGARSDWERAISLAPDTATADLAQQNLALLEAGPSRQ
jgi:tetratricopeptide (TPR) repeat protein